MKARKKIKARKKMRARKLLVRICRRSEWTCFWIKRGWCNLKQFFNFCSTYRRSYKTLANEYTENCLQKLSKPQLIAMVFSQRDETKATIISLRYEVKAMNTNFEKLEVDISIVKTINHLLKEFNRISCVSKKLYLILTFTKTSFLICLNLSLPHIS